MKNKHTPGPWKVIGNDIRTNTTETTKGGYSYFSIATMQPNSGDIPTNSNASLIAAAPELLAFVEYAIESHIKAEEIIASDNNMEYRENIDCFVKEGRELVKKARGE